MTSRINILPIAVMLILISVWGVSALTTLHDSRLQLTILGVVGGALALLMVKPEISVDGKLLLFAFAGYCIGGRGFAYLSPFPPLYIGEIALGLLLLGYLIRTKGNVFDSIKIDKLFLLIIIANIYAFGRILLVDFKAHGMMAVRDSSMIYYSLIPLALVYLMQKKEIMEIFKKLLPVLMVLGFVSFSIVYQLLSKQKFFMYAPHVDVAVPLTVAMAVCGMYLVAKGKVMYGGMMFSASMIPMLTDKTAFIFCFVLTLAFVIPLGRVREVYRLAVPGTLLALLGAVAYLMKGDAVSETLGGADFMKTVDQLSDTQQRSSIAWRIEWWKIVFRDTYATNPWFGTGLGSDITSRFMMEYMHVKVPEAHTFYLTRYPHNVLFTIFGRLGFVGVVFFILYVVCFIKFCLKYLAVFVARHDRELFDLVIVSIVMAGFFNAFVQSTFENPYAGIVHWTCLGAMLARYRLHQREMMEKTKGLMVA